ETGITVAIEETPVAAPGPPVGFKTSATLAEADRSKHSLYYAMQHFYANGGGRAYIVSVGPYKALGTNLELDEFQDALTPLSKVDEPALIVVPEAQALDDI